MALAGRRSIMEHSRSLIIIIIIVVVEKNVQTYSSYPKDGKEGIRGIGMRHLLHFLSY